MKKVIASLVLGAFIFSSCQKASPEAASPQNSGGQTTTGSGNSGSGSGSGSGTVTEPFSAKFTYSAPDVNSIFENQIIHFESKASGVVSYVWLFGNHAKSFVQNPDISYAYHGYYPVTLIVTDKDGKTDSFTQNISILCNFAGGNH